jgi:two-component system cell cycle sensor histidine kinase/response regulator CckA
VTVCEDGKTAVGAFRRAAKDGRPFDYAVLDLTIPGSGGAVAILSELRAIDPKAKVLVSSGYAEDPVVVRPGDFGFDGAVRKPYTIEQLSRALTAVGAE